MEPQLEIAWEKISDDPEIQSRYEYLRRLCNGLLNGSDATIEDDDGYENVVYFNKKKNQMIIRCYI